MPANRHQNVREMIRPSTILVHRAGRRNRPAGARHNQRPRFRPGIASPMESRRIEDLAAKLAGILPPGLRVLRSELEDNFRAVLRANLEKWDLVSRERFDTQAELLARTQKKLALLEKRLQALEQRETPHPDRDAG
ncbi:accessory factor UbiK family protein [Solimonas variicoloris]|uniref:accessory factor UbiK family protein n=1 Tax=Solimonas variicoloris TaxID=254408 RepID=UPI001FDF3DB4|nr:accessory factor UbiK family protein [Solimonas variicoloris]